MAELPRTCIIGAGLSGLTACKALGDRRVPYTCFEASDDIGGNWYFKNPNARSSAYRSLHIDTSKASVAFKDLPLSDEYPDYLHHAEIHQYFHEYADAFGLRESIRFETPVEHAERLPGGGWRIELAGGEEERFDALLVANGHHWDPRIPEFPGSFEGEALHSHHYIDTGDPLDMRGRRVLVVGIGNSAVDITSELSRKGVAERVILSTRSGAWVIPKYMFGRPADEIVKTIPWLSLRLQRALGQALPYVASGRMTDFGLPQPNHRFLEAHPTVSSELLLRLGSGDAVAKPNVAELLPDAVRFEDGSVEAVDTIVYATGYKISFPFFDQDFISAPENRIRLWKRMFDPGIDDLAFVGLAQAIPTLFPFSECQSKLLARWLAGEWALPSKEQMESEIGSDEERFVAHYKDSPRHTMQNDYRVYDYELRRSVIPAGRARAADGAGASLTGRARGAAGEEVASAA